MKIALLTIENLDGYTTDDELIIEPLNKLGYQVEFVPWRQTTVSWSAFDAAIIRSTWDYHKSPTEFRQTLKNIESQTRLANSFQTVEWNLDKIYLRDLEEKGALIVPTIWSNGIIDAIKIEDWYKQLHSSEIVIKPTISASSLDTFRVKSNEIDVSSLKNTFENRSCMIQSFMRGIVEEGEFSLFFFGGNYSHAILKSPKEADFRVQPEYGGRTQAIKPTKKLLTTAENVLGFVSPMPLYARIDFVRNENDDFVLMELELIEPALYFDKDGQAAQRFAEAVHQWQLSEVNKKL
jgi:glutathione synthase/RimK-type ligase-like ATP-grasp enzyme